MSVLIVIFLMMFALGCSHNPEHIIEYVQPSYAPLTDNVTTPNPEPKINEQNFVKWLDSIYLLIEFRNWGISERNRANTCVNIYQKTISENSKSVGTRPQ